MPSNKDFSLSATYSSPASRPFSFAKAIPSPPSASVADKTTYLESLGRAVSSAQDQINKELTARMDEDNARAAGNGSRGVDEAKEEENYGEEVQEEED